MKAGLITKAAHVTALALAGTLAPLCVASATGNKIESIEVAPLGGTTEITVNLREALASTPTEFITRNPDRISVDLPGTMIEPARVTNSSTTREVRATHAMTVGERTRIVVELARPVSVQGRIEGRQYKLALTPLAAAMASAQTSASAAPTPVPVDLARAGQVSAVDFRRGQSGSGQVIVDFDKGDSQVNVTRQGAAIVVDIPRARMGGAARRQFDVTDFGTPVRKVRVNETSAGVRLTIDAAADAEYSAHQADSRFVVDVRPGNDPQAHAAKAPTYKGERLTLNFQNGDIRSILQVFADFTNLNLVASDSVQGNLTLRLKDVQWDQALDIVLQTKGLASRRIGNVIWIAPKDEIANREKLELESQQQISDIEPLRSQVFQLNYQSAADVSRMLTGMAVSGASTTAGSGFGTSTASTQTSTGAGVSNATRVLSRRGSLTADPRTNQLFVSDIPSKLEEIQSFLARIDIPVRQVIIEARIVEADDKFSQNLGVKLGFVDLRGVRGGDAGFGSGSNRGAIGNSYGGVTEATGQIASTGAISNPFLSLPAGGLNGFNPGTMAISLFSNAANRFLNLELSALEADGRGKIVSSPRVVTADNVKALIEQGTELPYQSATSSGATAVSFRKANLKLEVTPKITPDGNVMLDVDVNKDSVGLKTDQGYAIDTKHVKTQILVENGGTVVIGGIFQQTERKDLAKVPVLGDLPVIGNLFRSTARIKDKTELLIFLTPRVVTDTSALR